MSIWQKIKDIFDINNYYQSETFSLGDRSPWEPPDQAQNEDEPGQDGEEQDLSNKAKSQGGFVKPKKANKVAEQKVAQQMDVHGQEIYHDLELNLLKLKARFNMPTNSDIVIREFYIPFDPPVRAVVAFAEGLSLRIFINNNVLLPLMLLSHKNTKAYDQDAFTVTIDTLLPGNQVEEKDTFQDLVQGILAGDSLILLEGFNKGILVETKGWEHRTVGRPSAENVVRGPQEAFVEHFRVNTALIRRRLRTDALVTELFKLGRISNVDCAVLYLKGITNPKLVTEVIRRIKSVDTDYISDSGTLEQFIEDHALSIVPGQLFTERPDRVASFLMEGHVAVIVDGDPYVLILPTTFWSLLHAAEDAYVRWPYATLFRLVRVMALFITLLLPSFYISIVNFHPEMIPTDLLLAIAASRETIPFPAIFEVVIMEVSFELIREAGIRIPSLIGPTLGIVGAIILGQAAVAANVISPLLVIIVALTGLGSFAIPNYSLSLAIRALRFVYLALAGCFGFYGMAVAVFLTVVHLCGQKSFGVPIISPVAPFRPPSRDVVLRRPVWQQQQRPAFMRPLQVERQPKITRTWDPVNGPELKKDHATQGQKGDKADD